jgi:hypothetical protein
MTESKNSGHKRAFIVSITVTLLGVCLLPLFLVIVRCTHSTERLERAAIAERQHEEVQLMVEYVVWTERTKNPNNVPYRQWAAVKAFGDEALLEQLGKKEER